jgi:putative FmdB family regulatory protein
MPTYQYACRACGHEFEAVQPMTDEPLRVCPRCGGELRKVYAPPAIAFRGSGFYATDHGKRASKSESEGVGKKEAVAGKKEEAAEKRKGQEGGGTGTSAPGDGGTGGKPSSGTGSVGSGSGADGS